MSDLDDFFGPSKAHAMADSSPEPEPPIRKVSPQEVKRRGEKWTKDYMLKLAGIYVVKRSDAPVVLPGGREYIPKGLDMYGSVMGPDTPFAWRVEVEVKTFSDGFALAALKEHQVKALYAARERGELAMLSLVKHTRGNIEQMWWILWPKQRGQEMQLVYYCGNREVIRVPTFSWVAAQLREKAEEDARFHAKSIREKDLSMLERFSVAKSGRTWQLSETHWMRDVFGMPVTQARLL